MNIKTPLVWMVVNSILKNRDESSLHSFTDVGHLGSTQNPTCNNPNLWIHSFIKTILAIHGYPQGRGWVPLPFLQGILELCLHKIHQTIVIKWPLFEETWPVNRDSTPFNFFIAKFHQNEHMNNEIWWDTMDRSAPSVYQCPYWVHENLFSHWQVHQNLSHWKSPPELDNSQMESKSTLWYLDRIKSILHHHIHMAWWQR